MRRFLSLMMIFSVLSMTNAYALSINDISVDFDSQSVIITGNGAPGEEIVIQIINPGEVIPDPEDGFVDGVFNHFGNTVVGEDGNYEYRFIMSGITTTDEHKYCARVAADSGNDDEQFDFTSIDDVNAKLDLINATTAKETMKANIEQIIEMLSFSPIAPYSEMSDSEKLQIADKMVGAKPFEDINNMLDTYNKFILIQALYSEADKAEFKSLINTYAADLFDSIYLSTLDEAGQTKSIEILMGNIKNAYDYEGLGFNIRIANLLVCGQTVSKNNLVNALVEYKDIFTTVDNSMTTYINSFMNSSQETKLTIAGKILDKCPTEISQISQIIKQHFTASKNPGSGSNDSSGGNGSTVQKKFHIESLKQPTTTNQPQSAKIFEDVNENHWAYEAISFLQSKNVINGKGDGKFGAEDFVTRAEMIKMLMLAFDIELTNDKCEFSDIASEDWFYKYISAAAAINVANGIGDGRFAPNMNVTREDMAVFLNRVLEYKGRQLEKNVDFIVFEDNSEISDYAKEAVYSMKNAGIIDGRNNGVFAPKDYATRAEMAKLLYTALQLKG